MNAPSWAPTSADVAGLVSDRKLERGQDTFDFDETTKPTRAWVEARIEAVANTVSHLARTDWLGSIAGEYVLYVVAADVDAGWNAGRREDQYTRSVEYRRMADRLYRQLVEGEEDVETAGAGSPVFCFRAPEITDDIVW